MDYLKQDPARQRLQQAAFGEGRFLFAVPCADSQLRFKGKDVKQEALTFPIKFACLLLLIFNYKDDTSSGFLCSVQLRLGPPP